ncbi:tRNA pseudouridine(55) synthase TruB [Salsipaludibacter albus]|uniref:tRNA pseudouridine(55) synthase TruB n=1 Tax=Salsipaludibacter albus TaxID=2849650 RepID=UPI001EE3F340|nr:tRNA pseudouridine(55) synthase TruB [Salsipaludibacter albus]MBY5162833.1 tRNA pseudouridine(55) synthase TruB [Salsipaludibacter albus]
MSRRRNDPDIAGVLVVDKPAGMTSHDVVAVVRRALGMRRVGHTGTLDPAATGVLVCAVGRATRLVELLQGGAKTYAATAVLGVVTDSQDADGEVLSTTDASHLTEHQVCEAMMQFMGTIEQVPPMVSALKVDGTRLHELARRGEEVERAARTVVVHDLVVEDWEPGTHPRVSFLVTCSAGTYVRTIAHDLGEHLGVGGSLASLRRVANGAFTVDTALSLDEVRSRGEAGDLVADLVTPAAAVAHLPRVTVDDETWRGLVHGQSLPGDLLPDAPEDAPDDPFAVLDPDGALVGIYRRSEDVGRPDLVLARPEDRPAAAGPTSAEEPA